MLFFCLFWWSAYVSALHVYYVVKSSIHIYIMLMLRIYILCCADHAYVYEASHIFFLCSLGSSEDSLLVLLCDGGVLQVVMQ